MRGVKLSQRLAALRRYYHHVPFVWDIGCDHAHLGLSFLEQAEVQEIHLVDPAEKVIQNLKNYLIDSYITIPNKIKIEHKFGQKIITHLSPKCLFIAGMGGHEIQEIIINLGPQMQPPDRLVISPHRKILELREYLYHSDLRLIEEDVIFEDGQFYQILCLSTDSQYSRVSLYGDKLWVSETGKKYRDQQLRTFINHQDKRSKAYFGHLSSLYP